MYDAFFKGLDRCLVGVARFDPARQWAWLLMGKPAVVGRLRED